MQPLSWNEEDISFMLVSHLSYHLSCLSPHILPPSDAAWSIIHPEGAILPHHCPPLRGCSLIFWSIYVSVLGKIQYLGNIFPSFVDVSYFSVSSWQRLRDHRSDVESGALKSHRKSGCNRQSRPQEEKWVQGKHVNIFKGKSRKMGQRIDVKFDRVFKHALSKQWYIRQEKSSRRRYLSCENCRLTGGKCW